MSDKRDTFEASLRTRLEQGTDGLDELTRARLAAARARAVAALDKPRVRWWMPAGAFAATAAVMVLAFSLWIAPGPETIVAPGLEDMPLLSAAEEPEFFEELEFLIWLSDETRAG